MDETHIFGRGELKPEAVFKLVSATLEISRIRETLSNFPKAKKDLNSVEVTLIDVANLAGISPKAYREVVNKVLAVRSLKKGAKLETASQDNSKTPDKPEEL